MPPVPAGATDATGAAGATGASGALARCLPRHPPPAYGGALPRCLPGAGASPAPVPPRRLPSPAISCPAGHRSHITEIFKVYIATAWLQKNQKFQRTFGCKMTPRFEHSKEACGVLLCGTYQIITDFPNQKKAAHFCAALVFVMLRFHKFFYIEAIFRFGESVCNFKRHNLVGFDCIRVKSFHVQTLHYRNDDSLLFFRV